MHLRFDFDYDAALIESPKLPIIPLPIDVHGIQASLPESGFARQKIGISQEAAVLLWIGRLSMFTKVDPWPQYQMLERLAKQLPMPLVLIELGPDDTEQQANHFSDLRKLCPNVTFIQLGGSSPATEDQKLLAFAASDLALSLVDNVQETFGLAVAESMAAGLPVVASDWDGYRDSVRNGVDGFLVLLLIFRRIYFPWSWLVASDWLNSLYCICRISVSISQGRYGCCSIAITSAR